jgi:hypothetical protein
MNITVSVKIHSVVSMGVETLNKNKDPYHYQIKLSDWRKKDFFHNKKGVSERPQNYTLTYQKEYFRPALVP